MRLALYITFFIQRNSNELSIEKKKNSVKYRIEKDDGHGCVGEKEEEELR